MLKILTLSKKELEPLYKDIKGVSDVFKRLEFLILLFQLKLDNKKLAKNKVSLQNVLASS